METINKKELLQKLDDVVEQHIADAVAFFQNRDDEFLNRPSATCGWSIAQCLDHLNSYGHYYLPRMIKELRAAPQAEKEGFTSTWMGAYFTKMMDPETGKRKFKAFKGHIPPSQLDSSAVVSEFIRQQEDLLYLLRDGKQKDLDAIRIPVSILPIIRMKIGDVLQFIIAHNERHMQQAKRNLVPQSIY
ncbi:DinB superfamily protein [Dyadobacter sp. SG02]|uniref:DinB family protein n=1 Tax=Dyadobacter sp. SG02 TaxID=1855291 RepID=UPI0008C66303|nr:DinB family protein [Dyadobacter sp. SG02]SEJ62118.1 DinB superfamily protein [Dyadobacter sp. SG02]